eukprot:3194476-Pyramimonas_sp.AAC.1
MTGPPKDITVMLSLTRCTAQRIAQHGPSESTGGTLSKGGRHPPEAFPVTVAEVQTKPSHST